MTGKSPEGDTHNTLDDALIGEQQTTPTRRATAQKRNRDSPSTPSRTRAIALIGSITDSVRTGAIRGLRALSDTIERAHDSASQSSGSDPPSPTMALRTAHKTPEGKRRRTVLTERRARATHANWRGTRWDYSGAIADKVFYDVGDTGPSSFSFPRAPATAEEDAEMSEDGVSNALARARAPRTPSVRSAASCSGSAPFRHPELYTEEEYALRPSTTTGPGDWGTRCTAYEDADGARGGTLAETGRRDASWRVLRIWASLHLYFTFPLVDITPVSLHNLAEGLSCAL
ncbi:hypothetical protein EXIGLDRAFT_783694 [Exidia glandulosa HHB12029]|uniref:Uncharacterized protein n=1 Tax=Exidia glandulosa HHB12029 TaxID=1314781 RepID=A0A166MXB4_EXIGL|nr:hypothetical protein EXIGLDRAFT_783694 [Exidia glandulosa HHB12029]